MTIHEPPVARRSSLPFDLFDADEQRRRGAAARILLEKWDADDTGYDDVAWPELRAALNDERRRIGARLLFPGE
jgi:hypothetical protein